MALCVQSSAWAMTKLDLQVQIGLEKFRQMSFILSSSKSWQEGQDGDYRFSVNVVPADDKAVINCKIFRKNRPNPIAAFTVNAPWGKLVEEVATTSGDPDTAGSKGSPSDNPTFRLKFTAFKIQM